MRLDYSEMTPIEISEEAWPASEEEEVGLVPEVLVVVDFVKIAEAAVVLTEVSDLTEAQAPAPGG